MIARLLYAAVALCVLGTRPEQHAATPPDRAPVAAAAACPGAPRAGIGSAPVDVAIPPNSR